MNSVQEGREIHTGAWNDDVRRLVHLHSAVVQFISGSPPVREQRADRDLGQILGREHGRVQVRVEERIGVVVLHVLQVIRGRVLLREHGRVDR